MLQFQALHLDVLLVQVAVVVSDQGLLLFEVLLDLVGLASHLADALAQQQLNMLVRRVLFCGLEPGTAPGATGSIL